VRDLAIQAERPHKLTLGDYYVLARPDGGVEKLDLTGDQWLDWPKRKAGTVTVCNVASFAQYYAKHHDDGSEVFADLDKGTVTAVLDAHGTYEAGGGGEDGARWQRHRLVLALQQTIPWVTWTGRDGDLMPQTDFAEFIEQNATDLDPECTVKGADLLEIAQEFHAHTTATFTKGTRLSSGQARFEWTEEVTARAGSGKGTIEIPTEFDLAIWPYEDCEPAIMAARFRYRVNGGDLKLGYVLNNPRRVAREAVGKVVEKLAAECGVTVMHGQPA
jgi:uncharacterized protein YfdQ (DUF2303 family)